MRVFDTERNITALRKQLRQEKAKSRRLIRECGEHYKQADDALKIDFQAWKENISERITKNIRKWQLEERGRINDEIAKITDAYAQVNALSLIF